MYFSQKRVSETVRQLIERTTKAAVQQGLFMGINIGDELLGCGAQVSALEEIFRLCKAVWPKGIPSTVTYTAILQIEQQEC